MTEITVRKQSVEIDPLLGPLLHSTDDVQISELLSQLLILHAEPVIKKIIRYKLQLSPYHSTGHTDANDLQQEAVMHVVAALQKFREHPDTNSISDLQGLAAVIAHRSCSRWMHQRSPERHALKNRLYYLFTRLPAFALWQNKHNKSVVGLKLWQGREATSTEEKTLKQLSNEEILTASIRSLKTEKRANWGKTLIAIFEYIGEPIEFDKLVSTLAALIPIKDQPMESIDQLAESIDYEVSDLKPDTAWQIEKRIFLQKLWEEVQQLPLNQRVALLLNLKDIDGHGCIALLPATGIATFRQLAEIMEMEIEKLAEIWNDLPLEDLKIADMLQITRQQVINARKSARERLTRRLKDFI